MLPATNLDAVVPISYGSFWSMTSFLPSRMAHQNAG